jgi:hypothetical protein
MENVSGTPQIDSHSDFDSGPGSSQSTSNSSVGNGSEPANGGGPGTGQTLGFGNGGDSLAQGNAYQDMKDKALSDFQDMLEKYGIKPPGEGTGAPEESAQPAGGSSSGEQPSAVQPAGGGQGAEGASGGGEAPSIAEIIKMIADKLGVSEDVIKQMLEGATSAEDTGTGQDTGTTAPSQSDAMFA